MRTRSSLEYTYTRRRNRRRSRQQQEAIPLILEPEIPMADDRPMAEQLQAPTGGFESAIVVPLINAQNFELKSSLINLVQNRIFRGGNDEEPHAHIRHFESITNNQRYPDVPNTTIKLLLFPFSLDGVAKTWLDKEPPNSILTWDDLVSKFINFFFPPSKTTNLRNEITNFRQIAQESFSEAWERFKELLRKCPHHGFSLMHQLDTFYNSLSYNDQDSLNSAAGGNFLYKSPTEGLQIIENKAKVRCSRNAVMRVSTNAPPSSNSSSNFEFQQMAAALEDKMTLTFRNEMNEMKNMMKALVPTPVPIKAVEERCTTCGSNHSFNVCPMTRGGYESPVYHDNFQQFQQTASVGNFVQNGNSGKPSNQGNIPHQGMVPYQSPPQNSQIVLASQLDIFKKTTEGSMQVMRNHITNLKAEIRSEVQATLQNQINSLKGEFKNELKSQHNLFMNQQNDFQNNLQNMLSGFFQNQSQPSTSTSMVPTTLPSNTITNPRCEARAITTRSGLSYTPVPPMPPPYVNPDNEKAKETEVTKDKEQPKSSQSTANVQPRVDHGKGKDKLKDNEKGMNEKEKDDEVRDSVFEEILIDKEEFFLPKTPPIIPNKPTKTLPYPSRVEYEKKGENDKVQIQKFWEMFKKIHVDITLADALILMPKYQKMLKSLLSNKEKLNEMANTPVSEKCSAIILKKLPEKLEDPGQFLIPCTFSELKCKALADLGARVARDRLGTGGMIDFPGRFLFFVVILSVIYRVPLILGRPFFEDGCALIDVFGEEMSLRTDEERLIIKKDEDSNAIFTSSEVVKCDFLTTNRDPITPPFTIPIKKDLTNEKVEKHEEVEGEKTLDVKTIVSFFAPIGNCVRKWATSEFVKDNDEINHEVFKSDNENVLGVHDNEEEEIVFLDGLLENENLFEMNDKNVEFLERKTKEDFPTKVEFKSKKELQVFHPDIEILNHFETTSYVGNDYVFYENFNLVDMIFPLEQ
ncbi:reverse transcriptase domain-containing protein [Tanacetum coccineum]